MDPSKAYLPSTNILPSLQIAWWSTELRLFLLLIQTMHYFHVIGQINLYIFWDKQMFFYYIQDLPTAKAFNQSGFLGNLSKFPLLL